MVCVLETQCLGKLILVVQKSNLLNKIFYLLKIILINNILLLGIEPRAAAWKAAMLPLHHNSYNNYIINNSIFKLIINIIWK